MCANMCKRNLGIDQNIATRISPTITKRKVFTNVGAINNAIVEKCI